MKLNTAVMLDQMLVHRGWLERLARSLIPDPGSADDVVQEVWLRALRAPPTHERSVRGWLGTVLRRVAIDRHRSVARRMNHERRASVRPEAGGQGADAVCDSETQRQVARAVLALGEPYRGVVLLRYFAGHSLVEVARAQAIPLETARTRLRRARDLLRRELDSSFGSRSGWTAVLMPLVNMKKTTASLGAAAKSAAALASTAGPSVSSGALVTGAIMGAKLAVIAGVIAIAVFGWAMLRDPEIAREADVGTADALRANEDNPAGVMLEGHGNSTISSRSDNPRTRAARASSVSATKTVTSAAAPEDSTVEYEGTSPGEGRLVGRIVDSEGEPLRRAYVLVRRSGDTGEKGGEGNSTADVVGTTYTDDDGYFVYENLEEGRYKVVASLAGFVSDTRLSSAGSDALMVILEKAHSISGTLVNKITGEPFEGVFIRIKDLKTSTVVHVRSTKTDEHGAFYLTEIRPGIHELSYGSPWQSGVGSAPALVPGSVEVAAGTTDLVLKGDPGLIIEGEIRDASGSLVTESMDVRAMRYNERGDPDYSTRRGTRSQPDGSFRILGLESGSYTLTVQPQPAKQGSASLTSAHRMDNVAAGTTGVLVQLHSGLPLRGRIVDRDGNAVTAGGNLYIYPTGSSAGSQGSVITRASDQGTFVSPPLDSAATFEVYATHFTGYMSQTVKGVEANGRDIEIVLESAGTIRGHVVDEQGKRVGMGLMVTARATNAKPGTIGRGWVAYTRSDGSFEMSNLGDFVFSLAAGGASSPYMAAKVVDGLKPGAKGVVLTVKQGFSISGVIVDAAGDPVTTHHLGASVVGSHSPGAWTRVETKDGAFALRGLPRGKVYVHAIIGGKSVGLGTYTVPATDLTITVPDGDD